MFTFGSLDRQDYKENYQMYDYVSEELPEYVAAHFPSDDSRKGVFGHSMGGLGALNVYLKSGKFGSVSAFSPICNPMKSAWGQKAFAGYLGDDQSTWGQWDPSELLKALVRVRFSPTHQVCLCLCLCLRPCLCL
jgi:S-formylglutathione hydrolase